MKAMQWRKSSSLYNAMKQTWNVGNRNLLGLILISKALIAPFMIDWNYERGT